MHCVWRFVRFPFLCRMPATPAVQCSFSFTIVYNV